MLHFFVLEGPGEDTTFSIGEPFLEHLIAAEFVVPDGSRDIAPESVVVNVAYAVY